MRGRKPEYHPRFSKSDLDKVGAVLRRRNASYEHVRRAKLAKLLAAEPSIRSVEASGRVGMFVQSVRKWRKRWATEGFSTMDFT